MESRPPKLTDDAASAALSDVGRSPWQDGAASTTFSELARKRLKWRCRRGMKELDFLLSRHLQRRAVFESDELAAFTEFLELPDPDIARYLLAGDVPPDPRHAALCRALLSD